MFPSRCLNPPHPLANSCPSDSPVPVCPQRSIGVVSLGCPHDEPHHPPLLRLLVPVGRPPSTPSAPFDFAPWTRIPNTLPPRCSERTSECKRIGPWPLACLDRAFFGGGEEETLGVSSPSSHADRKKHKKEELRSYPQKVPPKGQVYFRNFLHE